MKKSYIYIIGVAAMMLTACGGNGDKKKGFNPQDRTSTSMSIEERDAAIEAKRNSLAQEINIDSILSNHGVSFSVLPPAINTNLPQAASDKLGTKMIQIATQNSIGGLCKNPVLAMVSRVDCVQRELTGSAPQKAIVKYEVTMYCGNFITNDIYASSSQTITGVGSTFEDAASKAMNELKNTADMQKMLSTASERAIKWYGITANVKKIVDDAVSKNNYALAMALLSSVPEQAKATYAYAEKKGAEISDIFFQEKADELLAAMEDAINSAQGQYIPEVGAYYKLIPQRSKAFARARQLHDAYMKQTEEVRKDQLARERAVEDAVRSNEHKEKMQQLAYEHAEAMEQMEVDKIKAPYEVQATIERIKADAKVDVAKANAEKAKNANTGGFLGLGKLWDGGFGLANKIFDRAFGEK